MELIPTLLGALPDLGTIGVALVVLAVFRRVMQADMASTRAQMEADRAYFSEERARIRAEAIEDVALSRSETREMRERLLAELTEAKDETRLLDQEIDRLRALLYPPSPGTTVLEHPSRHRGETG